MKLLTYTTLYPNAVQQRHGIFVEQRLRHLLGLGGIESRVVAPVPWFPSAHPVFKEYADLARVPAEEVRNGIHLVHPRYPVIPKIGMTIAPFLLAMSTLPVLKRIIKQGYEFDLIDAHYFYPDGVAAAMLGKWLDKPVAITARGTDLNLIAEFMIPRRLIKWAGNQSGLSIGVSRALQEKLMEIGIDRKKTRTFRNGVDLNLFHLMDRELLRRKYQFSGIGCTLLSVGNLVKIKGHDLVIKSLLDLPSCNLIIVGSGEERTRLERLAENIGVIKRVRFVGTVSQEKLAEYYNIADALVLASSREGWANVLLESMACGTPVVATSVSGTPEVVREQQAGILIHKRSPGAIARAVEQLLTNYPDREATRKYAEKHSWKETVLDIKESYALLIQ